MIYWLLFLFANRILTLNEYQIQLDIGNRFFYIGFLDFISGFMGKLMDERKVSYQINQLKNILLQLLVFPRFYNVFPRTCTKEKCIKFPVLNTGRLIDQCVVARSLQQFIFSSTSKLHQEETTN